jgi:Zn-dependent peptidase ImmA (M78 family)
MKLFETLLKEKFELLIDDELSFDDRKLATTKKFLNFCCDELGLNDKFTCKIVFDRESNGVKTTAYYIDDNKLVVVYGKNRMLGDILRSIAHELIHQLQHQEGRIEYPVQDIGGEIEDEANAKAGSLVKTFIKQDEMGGNLFENRFVH